MLNNLPYNPLPVKWRYPLAFACIAIAVIVRFSFPNIFRGASFILFWPAVIISTWYGGFGPGVFASLLAALASIFLIRPTLNPQLDNNVIFVQLTLFVLMTVAISWFYGVRKKVDELTYRQQEWLRITLTSIGDGVIATDPKGRIVFMNPVAAEMTGWKVEEALGKKIQDVFYIINEITHQPVRIPIMEALEYGAVVGLANHTILISKDGTRRPIMDSGAPIRDADHEMIGAVLVFRDGTPQRDAARVQETLELVMAGIDEGFVIFDNEGHFTYANPRASQMGLEARAGSRERLLKLDEAFPQIIGTRLHDEIQQAAADKTNHSFEEYVESKDSWYEYRIYPTRSGLGIFVLDITERKNIEQKIALLQQLTTALTAAVSTREIAEIVADQGFRLLGAHMGSINLLRDDNVFEIIGRRGIPKELLVDPPVQFKLSDAVPLADAVRGRQPIFIQNAEEYKERYPKVYETFHPISRTEAMIALPMIVNEDIIGGIAMSFPKVLRLTAQERQFMQTLGQQAAQALKRALLSERTQEMAAIQERQRLAQDLHDSVSQALFSATTIAQAVPLTWQKNPEKAMEQLRQVVQINRAAMGEMRILLLELRPQAIIKTPLNNLLQHLIDAAKGRAMIDADLKMQGKEFELPSETHVALYRLAQESVNNILKHSHATEFTIDLRYGNDHVMLEVRDNGVGFDTTQVTGGMGLSNLRERAEDINAQLDITSAPGKGTTIRVNWSGEPGNGEAKS
ncbi:MAG: PAS domain-containing protein [Anaerolineae bacterium]|nr:PAS domain-containing protein [Anaerolineae bacterium]